MFLPPITHVSKKIHKGIQKISFRKKKVFAPYFTFKNSMCPLTAPSPYPPRFEVRKSLCEIDITMVFYIINEDL